MALLLQNETKQITLHPEGGPYPAVLREIRLHEEIETNYGVKDRLQLTFQTDQKLRDHTEGIEDDRPMTVSVFVNATLSQKGRLMGFITQQVPTTQLDELLADEKDVDIEALLLGTQWVLIVEHNKSDSNGRIYDNVVNAMKAPPEQQIAVWDDGEGF
jgi:hypothetical protein